MLSVIIKTHNGAANLPHSFAAMAAMIPPDEGWELIVVDNASTDATAQIVRQWQDRLPLVYAHEPRLGRSNAVNCGLALAQGRLIILTDDDVQPIPTWLLEWSALAERHPDASLFAGAIEPAFEIPAPSWVAGNLAMMSIPFGQTTPGRPEGEIRHYPCPDFHGANAAIRADIVRAGFRFDSDGARTQDGGEDTEFVCRLVQAGYRFVFSPAPLLRHVVPKDRVTIAFVLKRFLRFGRQSVRLDLLEPDATECAQVFGMRRYEIRMILSLALRLLHRWPGYSSTQRVSRLIDITILVGHNLERLAQYRARRKSAG